MGDYDEVVDAGASFVDRARKAVVAAALSIPAGVAAGLASGEPLVGAVVAAVVAAIEGVGVYFTKNEPS